MKTKEPRKIQGYTLVELMVAILIAFVVLGGVYQTLTRETIDMQREEIILDMQNNARVGVEKIAQEIRKAGFLGCGGDLVANTLNNNGADATHVGDLTKAADWDGQKTILNTIKENTTAGVDYLGTPLEFNDNAAAAHSLYDEGTDAISVVYLAGDVPLEDKMTASTTNPIKLKKNAFKEGDILYITDCRDASLFQKTNSTPDTAKVWHDAGVLQNNVEDLGIAYGATPARVYSLEISTFYVKKNELKHNSNLRTVASNIEDLEFEFMLDDSGNWSATVADPEQVKAVRISVLAMSEEVNDYTNSEIYDYTGSPYSAVSPNDHRYRYLAQATVTLRNADL